MDLSADHHTWVKTRMTCNICCVQYPIWHSPGRLGLLWVVTFNLTDDEVLPSLLVLGHIVATFPNQSWHLIVLGDIIAIARGHDIDPSSRLLHLLSPPLLCYIRSNTTPLLISNVDMIMELFRF